MQLLCDSVVSSQSIRYRRRTKPNIWANSRQIKLHYHTVCRTMSHFPSQITVRYILYYISSFRIFLFCLCNIMFSFHKCFHSNFYWIWKGNHDLQQSHSTGIKKCNLPSVCCRRFKYRLLISRLWQNLFMLIKLSGQSLVILNVKLGGAYGNHWASEV